MKSQRYGITLSLSGYVYLFVSVVHLSLRVLGPRAPMRRRRQRSARKRPSAKQPETETLLSALAKKEAELNRREDELESEREEVQRHRNSNSVLRGSLAEKNDEIKRLRQVLEEAQQPLEIVPPKCVPCEVRSSERPN